MHYVVKKELVDELIIKSFGDSARFHKIFDNLSKEEINLPSDVVSVQKRVSEVKLELAKEQGKIELLQHLCKESEIVSDFK